MSERVAAVDCGTNSLRLLVADVTRAAGAASLVDVVRCGEVVRLGQGVDRTGELDPAAIERTLAVCRSYADVCRRHGVGRVRFVATSATRDARNAADFSDGVRDAFGDLDVQPEVVSGPEEADLSFRGATGGLLAAGLTGPFLVVDLGGGSTELVRGVDTVAAGLSLDMGSVRMTERYLPSDPPTEDEKAQGYAAVAHLLDEAERVVPMDGIAQVVGLAGTITTITAHVLGLPAYLPDRVHLARLDVQEHRAACADLLSMTREQRARLPYLHPGRVDVIGAGALVWDAVLERIGERSPQAEVVTSEHDILDGIALGIAG